jgi:hypothetical protein
MRETERVKIPGGNVLFEYGPRSLRVALPASYSMLNLVREPLFCLGSYSRELYIYIYILRDMVKLIQLMSGERGRFV